MSRKLLYKDVYVIINSETGEEYDGVHYINTTAAEYMMALYNDSNLIVTVKEVSHD